MNSDDLFWATYTVYNEARGEVREGQKAVAKVILNRASGKNIVSTVTKAWQFSCFNAGIRPVINEPMTFLAVMRVCQEAFDEWMKGDNLQQAKHYYNPSLCRPEWAESYQPVATIGNHIFLK